MRARRGLHRLICDARLRLLKAEPRKPLPQLFMRRLVPGIATPWRAGAPSMFVSRSPAVQPASRNFTGLGGQTRRLSW